MKELSKGVWKVIVILIIVAAFAGFRDQMIANEGVGDVVSQMLEEMPFYKQIFEMCTKVLSFTYINPPEITANNILADLLKLAIMVCLLPPFRALMTAIFLPLPPRNQILASSLRYSDEADRYMNSAGYRVKEFFLKLICTIVAAFLAGLLLGRIQAYIDSNFGKTWTIGIMIALLIVLIALTIPRLMGQIGHMTFSRALTYRSASWIGEVLNVLSTEVLCAVIYCGIISGSANRVVIGVVGIFLVLILIEIAYNNFKEVFYK